MIKILNSAMMPAEGHYSLNRVSPEIFAQTIRHARDGWESYIGYAETAAFVSKLTGLDIPVSREQTTLNSGDLLAIIRLKYRVADPATKGKTAPAQEDFEFFLCEYEA